MFEVSVVMTRILRRRARTISAHRTRSVSARFSIARSVASCASMSASSARTTGISGRPILDFVLGTERSVMIAVLCSTGHRFEAKPTGEAWKLNHQF